MYMRGGAVILPTNRHVTETCRATDSGRPSRDTGRAQDVIARDPNLCSVRTDPLGDKPIRRHALAHSHSPTPTHPLITPLFLLPRTNRRLYTSTRHFPTSYHCNPPSVASFSPYYLPFFHLPLWSSSPVSRRPYYIPRRSRSHATLAHTVVSRTL
ncbi:hypothetical protein E2C01_091026 [Portunus trituberculatus]|uniref:Uncharacterized protein n=1 Tax=Portunus trituberculatus TaxID=210409 RepID=A0A5B7JGA5_PORTR|nr:hypothetical protein [Portunus trituberculatus]